MSMSTSHPIPSHPMHTDIAHSSAKPTTSVRAISTRMTRVTRSCRGYDRLWCVSIAWQHHVTHHVTPDAYHVLCFAMSPSRVLESSVDVEVDVATATRRHVCVHVHVCVCVCVDTSPLDEHIPHMRNQYTHHVYLSLARWWVLDCSHRHAMMSMLGTMVRMRTCVTWHSLVETSKSMGVRMCIMIVHLP